MSNDRRITSDLDVTKLLGERVPLPVIDACSLAALLTWLHPGSAWLTNEVGAFTSIDIGENT